MGVAKNYLIDRDEALSALRYFLRRIEEVKHKHKKLNTLFLMGTIIAGRLDDNSKMYFNAVRQLQDSLPLIKQILHTLENQDTASVESSLAVPALENIFNAVFQLIDYDDKAPASGLNSAEYYEQQIKELQKQKVDLEQQILQQQRQAKQSNKQQAETEKQRKETEKELETVRTQLEQTQREEAARKRREDAQAQLKADIQATFKNLNSYSAPFETEKKRLNGLFCVYATLSLLTLVALVAYECHFMLRFDAASAPDTWMSYLPFYLPVPLCAGLLWAFIFQMNRAQRQLVVLTDKLHHVKYIEGLLLALTGLSTDMAEAASKIRQTIDSIIDNYLHHPHDLTEARLQKEVGKDNLDLGELTKLMREIKEVVKK